MCVLLMVVRGVYKSRGYGTIVAEAGNEFYATVNAGK